MAKNNELIDFNDDGTRRIRNIILWSAAGFILIILLFGTFYTIPAGYRGVLLTFGAPSMNAKGEGLHIKIPLVQQVVKMEVRTQKYQSDLTAASRDLQDVKTTIAINYHLIPSEVPKIYQAIGYDYSERLIQPLESETNKQATALYEAQELIQMRDKVRTTMVESLKEKLEPRGIIIEEVSIVNFEFSKAFTDSIELKMVAQQLKLKADNDLLRIEVEAAQKVVSATAEAEALRLQKEQISPDLIKLRQIEVQKSFIDKWEGKLPLVYSSGGGGLNPFIDISSLMGNVSR
jgi:regulator of protease activity HflC (stomatin/prohibitin superfamily)